MQTTVVPKKSLGSGNHGCAQVPRGALVLGAIERVARDQWLYCHHDGPSYNNHSSNGHSKSVG